jgi:hypothetical protein
MTTFETAVMFQKKWAAEVARLERIEKAAELVREWLKYECFENFIQQNAPMFMALTKNLLAAIDGKPASAGEEGDAGR